MRTIPFVPLAVLLSFAPVPSRAENPLTIPPDIVPLMKKGRKLERVWVAPEFDGTKGFRLGAISNETERSVAVVQEIFPLTLKKFIKPESPYVLDLAIVSLRLKDTNQGISSAHLKVEGRIMDQGGKIVSAFTTFADESIGGNAKTCARVAVSTISFGIAKDVMQGVPLLLDQSPAVIVPAPAAATPPSSPAAAPPVAVPAAEPAAASPPVAGSIPAPAPEPITAPPSPPPAPGPSTPAPPPAASPAPVAQPAPPPVMAPIPALIPAEISADLKPGSALRGVWISPSYDRAGGFAIGEVRYRVEARNDGVDKFLPDALAKIATPGSPCLLELQIVELTLRPQSKGSSSVALGVEGRVVDKTGALMAAFRTRETVAGIGDQVDDCVQVSRRVVQAIAKDLR